MKESVFKPALKKVWSSKKAKFVQINKSTIYRETLLVNQTNEREAANNTNVLNNLRIFNCFDLLK